MQKMINDVIIHESVLFSALKKMIRQYILCVKIYNWKVLLVKYLMTGFFLLSFFDDQNVLLWGIIWWFDWIIKTICESVNISQVFSCKQFTNLLIDRQEDLWLWQEKNASSWEWNWRINNKICRVLLCYLLSRRS